MADEAIITQDTEVSDVKIEGTVDAEVQRNGDTQEYEPKNTEPSTVPLSVYLELKDDLKTLKQEIRESKGREKGSVVTEGVSDLAKKYPDVSQEFIEDMLSASTSIATKKVEEKYSPIIEKQEQDRKQADFDRAFDNLFDGALKDNPDLPQNIDKDLVKTLALTPKYRNVPVADILVKMYSGAPQGKASSENEGRTSADRVEDLVDFGKITTDQRNAVMADPKARQKYFSWLDTQVG